MFGKPKSKEEVLLEGVSHDILVRMEKMSPTEEDYPTMITHLERLAALRITKKRKPVSFDTLVLAGANLLGIAVIAAFEQKHVWTSKATPFIQKPK